MCVCVCFVWFSKSVISHTINILRFRGNYNLWRVEWFASSKFRTDCLNSPTNFNNQLQSTPINSNQLQSTPINSNQLQSTPINPITVNTWHIHIYWTLDGNLVLENWVTRFCEILQTTTTQTSFVAYAGNTSTT